MPPAAGRHGLNVRGGGVAAALLVGEEMAGLHQPELSDELLLVPVVQQQRPLVPVVLSGGAVPRRLVGLQGGQRHLADVADLVPGGGPGGVPAPVVHADVHADLGRGEGFQAALGLGLVPLLVGLLIAAKEDPRSM